MVNLSDSGFTPEQSSYLSGFVSGILQGRELPFLGQDGERRFTHEPEQSVHGTPIDDLCKEERIKHEQHGLDCYDAILANAASGEFPKDGDVFRYKFHGLFFVSPAQESLMLRCRIAGGALSSQQFRGLAVVAEKWGPGHVDLTTRANVQVREIMPENAPDVLMTLSEIGLTSQGSGADNIRNITATPTTGFDPDELIDVMPYARAMHHYILKNRDLYGLPRKFNISYDSGGSVSVCADTNDIGFYAVKVGENEQGLKPGVYFRMQLCGITGHQQFATDCGVLLTPAETVSVAAALIRVFIENGDRTNRKRARLKYLVDDWGFEKTLEETQKKLAFPLRYFPLESCEPSAPKAKQGYLGIHQQNDGKHYIGVLTPVGRISVPQMLALADVADEFGCGEIRLTVWQNLIIPGIPEEKLQAAITAIQATGLDHRNNTITGGLIACTGSRGCKYAAADTKGNAVELGAHLASKMILDQPVNIHLTGCHHSCAQHYIGDIGMMGTRVKEEDGSTVDGYNIVLGGGVDDQQAIAREVWKSVRADEIGPFVEQLLCAYLARREESESFAAFSRRLSVPELQALADTDAAATAAA
ncbi:NirA family protein [Luteolibacter sp. GHJ8]|uniref:NirA family protein n=1 Tax=Luteolibacter rhizosphaerae TaxID=2989719 RepID=A0ABT3G765_9BACT|nr:NirA family protein [Luteolibacter rhizosphaerae]MCW1915316.1 NirA family protein [Luteolibacter rhizosphaerae]